ncbi:MAG: hypothetical protein K2J70_00965, partial [Muribaculaceae bacterium]|nr:hypothetical protein [Muribaculaceae bacterium]
DLHLLLRRQRLICIRARSSPIGFDGFAGIYAPDPSLEEWVKKGDSKDVVFKFKNGAGQQVEMKVSQSGGVSELDFSNSDWDYEYNPGTGTYEEQETIYTYYLSIPKNITATLTENGTQLASTTVVSSIDVKGHTFSADVNATLMNLKATVKMAGNDNAIESRTELFADNQKIATAYATVEGDGLCDLDRYKELEDLEEDMLNNQLGKMLKKGNCGLDFLGKVQVYGQLTYYEKLPLDLDGSFDGWEYDKDKTAAQKAVQEACDRLNKNIKAQLRYNNTKTDQATILFQPGFEDWDYMWEYYTDCVLLFPDDTKYSMETYFKNFTNVTGKFDSLVDAYLKMWNQAKR